MTRGMFEKFDWPKATRDNWIEMVKSFDDGTICWTNDPKVIPIQDKLTLTDVFNIRLIMLAIVVQKDIISVRICLAIDESKYKVMKVSSAIAFFLCCILIAPEKSSK